MYIYGDQTIKVDCDSAEVLPGECPPLGIDGVNFGSSPNLAMDHIIYELCLSSECDTSEPDELDVYLRRLSSCKASHPLDSGGRGRCGESLHHTSLL